MVDASKVIGFDCCHFMDFCPNIESFNSDEQYRTLEYCIEQCEDIIDQIFIFKNKYVLKIQDENFNNWKYKNRFVLYDKYVATNNENDYLLLKMTW
jgi:hypothetical protein